MLVPSAAQRAFSEAHLKFLLLLTLFKKTYSSASTLLPLLLLPLLRSSLLVLAAAERELERTLLRREEGEGLVKVGVVAWTFIFGDELVFGLENRRDSKEVVILVRTRTSVFFLFYDV